MRRVTGLSAAIELLGGPQPDDDEADRVAARILDDVRRNGDAAVTRISEELDGEAPGFLEVSRSEIDAALTVIPVETREALETAAERVRAFQTAAMPQSWHDDDRHYGELVTPVKRVGAYVPGGTAPLASTVIMTVVPARVAGVDEIFLATPAAGDALPHPAVLAAAAIAGADRVFKIGGAQAIGAFAYGTETVPPVDLIVGPGNVWVTAAKRQLFGRVGIDGLYGPTETLVVADQTSDPEFCASDLLAQAEHDVRARPILVSTTAEVADGVEVALKRQLGVLPRKAIAAEAVEANGVSVIVASVKEAIEVANVVAPEHLCLAIADPAPYISLVRSAGGLFAGEYSAEVMGDYVAGPSHVMPTGGTARFASALNVRHFLRYTPVVDLDGEAFMAIARQASVLARTEGLHGHANAAELRMKRFIGE
ncbi:MAG: histidinol dehydrogenase [Dehalococcoidia bacterium]|jgi:histidinol dehydrogenase|nr:histidinol dehydrogenase [Dehalococcoidia bacterium]